MSKPKHSCTARQMPFPTAGAPHGYTFGASGLTPDDADRKLPPAPPPRFEKDPGGAVIPPQPEPPLEPAKATRATPTKKKEDGSNG